MLLKGFSIGAAVLAVILSPVIPALAGSASQGQSNATPATPPGPPPTAAEQAAAAKAFPPGDGRDEVIHTCSGCHSLTVVSSQRMSESDWTNTVIEMRGRGATGSDADMVKIVEYLAKNFGPNSAPAKTGSTPAATGSAPAKINVNTAVAADIATGLAIPREQAQAIVDYREKNGKFTDLDALKKVPGIDADKIDAAKGRIEF